MRATETRPSFGMLWKHGGFLMRWVSRPRWEFGPSRPRSPFPSTADEVNRLRDINTGNRGQVQFGMWRSKPKAGRRAVGAKDLRAGWNRGFLPRGCNLRTGS